MLNSRQITEWQAYAIVEPFGEVLHDKQMAQLALILVKGLMSGKDLDIDDFCLIREPKEQEEENWEEWKRQLEKLPGFKRAEE